MTIINYTRQVSISYIFAMVSVQTYYRYRHKLTKYTNNNKLVDFTLVHSLDAMRYFIT